MTRRREAVREQIGRKDGLVACSDRTHTMPQAGARGRVSNKVSDTNGPMGCGGLEGNEQSDVEGKQNRSRSRAATKTSPERQARETKLGDTS